MIYYDLIHPPTYKIVKKQNISCVWFTSVSDLLYYNLPHIKSQMEESESDLS